MNDNSLGWIILILLVDFVAASGWLILKIMRAKPTEKPNPEKEGIHV